MLVSKQVNTVKQQQPKPPQKIEAEPLVFDYQTKRQLNSPFIYVNPICRF